MVVFFNILFLMCMSFITMFDIVGQYVHFWVGIGFEVLHVFLLIIMRT